MIMLSVCIILDKYRYTKINLESTSEDEIWKLLDSVELYDLNTNSAEDDLSNDNCEDSALASINTKLENGALLVQQNLKFKQCKSLNQNPVHVINQNIILEVYFLYQEMICYQIQIRRDHVPENSDAKKRYRLMLFLDSLVRLLLKA